MEQPAWKPVILRPVLLKPVVLKPELQRHWMARLLRHAQQVGESGERPVAALVLDAHGRCVGWGSNTRHRSADPLGHAGLPDSGLALMGAAQKEPHLRFHGVAIQWATAGRIARWGRGKGGDEIGGHRRLRRFCRQLRITQI